MGRIFEGHVNAFKLISLFGNEEQIEDAAKDLEAGHLFAIWNAEAANGVRFVEAPEMVLTGAKAFCSAAGYVTRALITAQAKSGLQMLLIPLEAGARVLPSTIDLHGMRATQTAGIDFDGMNASADAFIGGPGDYLKEPAFSGGAWRTSRSDLGGSGRADRGDAKTTGGEKTPCRSASAIANGTGPDRARIRAAVD